MRIGMMLGPARGRYRQKVAQLIEDARAAERNGFTSVWLPQIPGDFDAFVACTLIGQATEEIEIGTAVVPIQTRHPVAMAQEVMSVQAVCEGRFTLGLGVSHDWVIEGHLGLPYERPAHQMRSYWSEFAYRGDERMDFRAHHLRNVPREEGGYEVRAAVQNAGGFEVPVEIRLVWEDGSASDFAWDGREGLWDLRLPSEMRAVQLQVDPRRVLFLDRNWLDNELTVEPDTERAWNAALRALLWAQQVLHYYGGAG